MLPESQAALEAIGKVEAALRSGLAAESAAPAAPAPLPLLTLGASWLCEALENFLSAQEDAASPPDRVEMARAMLDQAMRSMGEGDWASLDLFPEKASRVRVLTDRLREDMRRTNPPKPVPAEPLNAYPPAPAPAPLDPTGAALAMLERFGFRLQPVGPSSPETALLAERPDLLLLLQLVDLAGKSWRLPQGLLGVWFSQNEETLLPGRKLWQLLARKRLRHADPRPLAGLIILHGGKIEQEEMVAELVAADRRRSAIGLAWLDELSTALPSLEQELQELTEGPVRERAARRSEDYSAAQP